MKVGIDVRKIADYGIGTYIRNLVFRFAEMAPQWEWILFHRPGEEKLLPTGKGVTPVEEEARLYSGKELFSLSAKARRLKLDLFHAPHYTLPLRLSCPAVVTIHDLIHLLLPDCLPHPLARHYARFMIGRALRTAAGVITVSRSSEGDLERLFPECEGRVNVIPNGVEGIFVPRPLPEVREWLAHSLDIKGDYLLFVGNPKKHKNLELLMQAYSRIRTSYPGLELVVVGGDEDRHRTLTDRTRALGIKKACRFFGTVDSDTLALLYSAATVFVFPSLYEGFGLPPLEAMSCGAPVAASTSSSIPEVLGPAAVYFSPHSVDSVMTALCLLLDDPRRRSRLSETGRRRALFFSWDEAARRTLEVYRQAAGGGS